ncbi:MAG: O-antigen ligase family protein [Solirubrobacteraceae bacterium]
MKSLRLPDNKAGGPLLVAPSARGITRGRGTDGTTAIVIGSVAVGCVVMGATIAGGPTIGGHRLARAAIIGVPLIAVAVALIVDLGPKALPIWVAVSPLAYPFLRYPFHRGGYVTFDRVWIFALFLILLRLPRPPDQHQAGRLLRNGIVLLAVVYGTRLLLAPFGSLTEARYWLDAMVLPIVVYSVSRRVVFQQGEGGVLGALVVAGVVMSIISIAELVLGFSLAGFSGGTAVFDALAGVQRVSGPYASNASSSTAALVCLAAAIYWTRQRSGDAKIAGFIAIAIIAAGALASFHRAAGIAVVAIFILGTVPGAHNRSARYATISMIGVAAALAFYVVSGTVDHSTFFQGRVASTTNVTGRFASWDQSVAIFRQSPVIGVGVGQAPVVQQKQGLFTFDGQQAALTIHNSFLTVLAENGVVGEAAILLLSIAVVNLLIALRRYPGLRVLYACVLAGTVAFLVMSLTLTILLEAPAVLMFAVLLGVGAGRLDKEVEVGRTVAARRAISDPGIDPTARSAHVV